jgi:hypothetical protein
LGEETRVAVPMGERHQTVCPAYEGPWAARMEREGDTTALPSIREGVPVAQRRVTIEAARATAARLTAAAYGVAYERMESYSPADEDMKVYPEPETAQQQQPHAAAPPAPDRSSLASAPADRSTEADGGGEDHSCEYCGKVLAKAGALTMHIRFCKVRLAGGGPRTTVAQQSSSAALSQSASEQPAAATAAEEDGHLCDKCLRSFGSRTWLSRHACTGGAEASGVPKRRRRPSAPRPAKSKSAPTGPEARALSADADESEEGEEGEEELLAQPDVFVVERLLGERFIGQGAKRRRQYLVRWEGFDDSENTWEDEAHILDDDLVDEFKTAKRSRKQP